MNHKRHDTPCQYVHPEIWGLTERKTHEICHLIRTSFNSFSQESLNSHPRKHHGGLVDKVEGEILGGTGGFGAGCGSRICLRSEVARVATALSRPCVGGCGMFGTRAASSVPILRLVSSWGTNCKNERNDDYVRLQDPSTRFLAGITIMHVQSNKDDNILAWNFWIDDYTRGR